MSLPFNQNSNPVPVYFARVPETPQNQPYEPQRVRLLENASAVLIVDNTFRTSGTPFRFSVTFTQFIQNIRRIAVGYVQFEDLCGNINRKNNTLRVVVTTGAVGTYTMTLTPGYYPTGASVVAMMNPILGAALPGLSISWSDITQTFTLTYNGIDSFFIDPTCPFIVYGIHMWSFAASNAATIAPKVSERAILRFNTALIIKSQRFTQFEKNNSTGSNSKTANNFQVILYSTMKISQDGSERMIFAPIAFPSFKTYESQTQITDADIEILDEWGDSPEDYTDAPTTWHFQMEIINHV